MSNSSVENNKLIEQVKKVIGKKLYSKVSLIKDTTSQINIYRGHVVELEDRRFFVLGDVTEKRFGLDDQPKYWVKKTKELSDGKTRLLKLVFFEEFMAHVGPIRIRCFRSPSKESKVLEIVRGDMRFMQGVTLRDDVGNKVKVIDFIHGPTLYDYIFDINMDHEEYFHTSLPGLLKKLIPSMEAIKFLHEKNVCHGDIRNDHIFIDRDSGDFRWIDFDLSQHFPDYDVWSFGNILAFLIGKGMLSFHEVNESDDFDPKIISSLRSADAAAFYHYRIMNLGKVYKYIPEKLNNILMRFSAETKMFYESMGDLIEDFGDAVMDLPSVNGRRNKKH